MTEFENYQAMMISVELSAGAGMSYLAIVAMYLIAAYVVGKDLPKVVAVGMSVIYTLFLIPPLAGSFGNLQRTYNLGAQLSDNYPDSVVAWGALLPFDAYLVLTGIPMIVGWLGSLYFMHAYIRSQQPKNA